MKQWKGDLGHVVQSVYRTHTLGYSALQMREGVKSREKR